MEDPVHFVSVNIGKATFGKTAKFVFSFSLNEDGATPVETISEKESPKPTFPLSTMNVQVNPAALTSNNINDKKNLSLLVKAFALDDGDGEAGIKRELVGSAVIDLVELLPMLLSNIKAPVNVSFKREEDIVVGKASMTIEYVKVMGKGESLPSSAALGAAAGVNSPIFSGRKKEESGRVHNSDTVIHCAIRDAQDSNRALKSDSKYMVVARIIPVDATSLVKGVDDAVRDNERDSGAHKSYRERFPTFGGKTDYSNLQWNEVLAIDGPAKPFDENSWLLRFDLLSSSDTPWGGCHFPLEHFVVGKHYNLECELPLGIKLNMGVLLDSNTTKAKEVVGFALEGFDSPLPFPVSKCISVVRLMTAAASNARMATILKTESPLPVVPKLSLSRDATSNTVDGRKLVNINSSSDESAIDETLCRISPFSSSSGQDATMPSWRFPTTFEIGGESSRASKHYPLTSEDFTVHLEFFKVDDVTNEFVFFGAANLPRPIDLLNDRNPIHVSEVPVHILKRDENGRRAFVVTQPKSSISLLISSWPLNADSKDDARKADTPLESARTFRVATSTMMLTDSVDRATEKILSPRHSSTRQSARPTGVKTKDGISPRTKMISGGKMNDRGGISTDGEGDGGEERRGSWTEDATEQRRRIERLENELNNKQSLVERLIGEVDRRSEAIRNCGIEIVQLRRKLSETEYTVHELKTKLSSKSQEETSMAIDLGSTEKFEVSMSGNSVSRDHAMELMSRVRVLGQKYLHEKKRNDEIAAKLSDVNSQLMKEKSNDVEVRKLEKACEAQARHIQKLQEQNAKVQKYKDTIITQEKVIAKLETLIENKLRERQNYQPNNNTSGSNPNSSKEAEQLKQKNENLISDIDLLRLNHKMEMDAKDSVIRDIEDQMKVDSRKYGAQIADLRTKLLEMEVVAVGGFGSPAEMLYDLPPGVARDVPLAESPQPEFHRVGVPRTPSPYLAPLNP